MELEMSGLTVRQMGHWLAAVGMLRALHRHAPDATLHWEESVPYLGAYRDGRPGRDPERLIADDMVFSAVVTSWQSGGGWGDKDRTPKERLDELRCAEHRRLSALRKAVRAADGVMVRAGGRDKPWIVRHLRNHLPDDAIPWLNVAVPLCPRYQVTDEWTAGVVGWAPLAGTGGNAGRWDISTNYHAAILALNVGRSAAPDGTASGAALRRREWLTDLLYGTQDAKPIPMSGGPYWPQEGDEPILNPWQMILTVEGLLAFGDGWRPVYGESTQPWTTELGTVSPDGPIGVVGWGEAWLPMWDRPLTMPEVRLVLGGPWPRWRARRATEPGNVYAAWRLGARYGWPAGVGGVARFGLVQRNGRSNMAVLLDLLEGYGRYWLPEPEPDVPVFAAEEYERHRLPQVAGARTAPPDLL